jgi:hypothetical protein
MATDAERHVTFRRRRKAELERLRAFEKAVLRQREREAAQARPKKLRSKEDASDRATP